VGITEEVGAIRFIRELNKFRTFLSAMPAVLEGL
jgi:hypothetical protein